MREATQSPLGYYAHNHTTFARTSLARIAPAFPYLVLEDFYLTRLLPRLRYAQSILRRSSFPRRRALRVRVYVVRFVPLAHDEQSDTNTTSFVFGVVSHGLCLLPEFFVLGSRGRSLGQASSSTPIWTHPLHYTPSASPSILVSAALGELPSFPEAPISPQPPVVSKDSNKNRQLPPRPLPLDRMDPCKPHAIRGTRVAAWTETSPASIPLDATLSELPFFPEECTLSQLPFFSEDRVDDLPLPPTPPTVCEECWRGPFAMHFGIAFMSPQDGKHYRRWPEANTYVTTLAKLKSRADAGCVWCEFVFECGNRRWPRNLGKMTVTVRGTKDDEVSGRSDQVLSLYMDGEHIDGLWIYAAPDDLAASYITTRSPILTDVKSPRTLDLARQLIIECIDKHELCKAAASLSPHLPTRLVDCTDLARPRLVSAPSEHGHYLALSYVWGKDSEQIHYRTTASNLPTYEHRIDPRVLPLTIRDAIYVTHQLGFRWLWVDSLCIIQDSDEDKAHEIGRMHHIYRYAHVTIMAASAEGVRSGFLQKRSPPDDFVLGLPFICPPYPQNTSQKLQVGRVYLTRGSDFDTSHGDELGFMARRAWCMQEYLLSPRALIFAPSTLLFRCLTADAAGVGSSAYSIEYDLRIPTSLFLPRTAPAAEPNSKEWEEMCEAWMNVVWDYTRRTASDESDKLVACAAVAAQFHFVLGSEYLAGLWRSDTLLMHLLWKADKSTAALLGCRHTRPAAYRAPSWSWAAIEGPAFYDSIYPLTSLKYRQHAALAEVAECWVTVKDPALPFGRVTDGDLVLRGTLILCHGRSAARSSYSDWWTFRVQALPIFEQVRRQWQRGLQGLISDEEDAIYSTKPGDYASVIMDYDVDEPPERMWLVPFVRTKSTSNNDVQGIVLQLTPPSDGSGLAPEKIRFRRIGYFVNFVKGERPGKAYMEHPLWDPLTRAVKVGEPLWVDIEII